MIKELKVQDKSAHNDWVRDVAWCNNIGTTKDMIATCGEDKSLKIWKDEYMGPKKMGNDWKLAFQHTFEEPCYKCDWSQVGFMLAVSSGENLT